MRIGYYVHHHGRGHATRAGVIGAALTARGHDVTYLGSGALPGGDVPSHVAAAADGSGGPRADRVVLTPDADARDLPFVDAEANGRLHWAPFGGGYTERSAQIAAWVAQERPDVMVVDVSVEVTALVRLLGVPVVVVGQPGRRDDAPHVLAFDLATAVLAPWPAGLDVAPHLARHRDKSVAVGGLSRFARSCADSGEQRRGRAGAAADPAAHVRGMLLVGGEGWDDPELPDAIRHALPEVAWHSPSPEHPIETLLATTDVVVTHAGQNALADVAAFGVPAVVLPQARPFDEQADMARALDEASFARGLALGASADEAARAVRDVLAGDNARSTGAAWSRWNLDGAADRAADVVECAARSGRDAPHAAAVQSEPHPTRDEAEGEQRD